MHLLILTFTGFTHGWEGGENQPKALGLQGNGAESGMESREGIAELCFEVC